MRSAAVAMMLVATMARADSTDIVERGLVLARGELHVDLTIAANARTGAFARPLSLAPDAWYGITPKLTVGLVHSARSVDEVGADRPLCVRDCELTYAVGADVLYAVHRFVAPRVRVLVRDVDPAKPAVTLGAFVHLQRGRFAIESDPYLRLGLANTDLGNRAALVVPVQLAVQPTCKWLVGARAGYDSALAVARDGWRGPFAVLAAVHPIEPLTITAELAYKSVIGPQHEFKERTVLLVVGWRARVQ